MLKRSILLLTLVCITPLIIINQPFASCCIGTTGNVDGSADDIVDISDVFAMVDYLGSSIPISTCPEENDVNIDGTIDIADLFVLIDFLSGMAALPPCGAARDIDGNYYRTVTIGTQMWMAENLKVTHYRNGDPMPNVTDSTTWPNLTAGAYCNYANDTNNVATYGRLYNWFAAVDSRNIAPAGWHVPSDAEWKQLEMTLGMSQAQADGINWRGTTEGGKLKEAGTTHWQSPNTGATNGSGFSGLPGGCRDLSAGAYCTVNRNAIFWSSTEINGSCAWDRILYCDRSDICRNNVEPKVVGLSVRCVRD